MATSSTISAVATLSPTNPTISHPSQIIISEDLKQAALDHLSYLKEFYEHPELQQKQAREYAVYRYENFWLPFLVENSELDIVPPLDILFVWHSHMLAPTAYASDCERLFERILPTRIRERTPQLLKFSEQLWTKKYNRAMPFRLDYTTNTQVTPPYTTKIKYALSQAVERQADFYYNVSLGHYKDSDFLEEAVKRYRKFVYLKRLNPQLFIVPMYDIDLIWHTHQLFPDLYRRDMMANLNHVLHHDDTTQDRTSNSKLSTADHETRHKWFELYGDRLPKNGCMYRGISSKNIYQYVNDFNFLLECQRYTLYVQLIDTNDSSFASVTKKEANSDVNTVVPLHDHSLGEPLREQFFAQMNTSEQELFIRGSSGHIEAHFEADYSDFAVQLTLKIQQKAGYWPVNYFSTLAQFDIPPEKVLSIAQFNAPVLSSNNSTGEDDPNALYYLLDTPIEASSPLGKYAPNAKRLVVGVPAVDINTVIVRYELSAYDEVTLDQNYLAQLGTTFLFNLENVKVQQALHAIQPLHQEQPVLLNIRHTIINDIDIFTATFNDVILVSCHTLNWSQLPMPNQVSNTRTRSVLALNPENEEALIVKDHTGDWGMVKFSKDLFNGSAAEAANEKNYQFSLHRYKPDGLTEEEIIYVDWDDDKWLIGSSNFAIEMNTWSISVKRIELKNSMQYICLGSALISRFDALFKASFGNTEEVTNITPTTTSKGNPNGTNNLLANDIGKINLNGTNGLKDTKNTLNGGKNAHVASNNV